METLRILWFNWRCIKHPLAGGAEVYTHEIAKRLVKMGHEVIWVTARPKELPPEEIIEGYKVIRRGNKYTVYLKAKEVYHELKKQGWKPDMVIDEVNTIPFFTPLYVKEPIVMLIHQLCKECWRYAIHPLAERPGWLLEKTCHKLYVKAVRDRKIKVVITVSESTRQDLLHLGYPRNRICIVYNGLEWALYRNCNKLLSKKPLVTYIGRITPYKRLEDLIRSWRIVEQKLSSEVKLVIAGRPKIDYLDKLKSLTRKIRLKSIEFKVNISQEEKKSLLAKASVFIYTSIREGWGQIILEAAACKTPTIAYDVPGLRDSVKHMRTGILVRPGNIGKLAQTITYLLTDYELRSKLAENAYRYAQQYSWEKTVKEFLKVIKGVVHG